MSNSTRTSPPGSRPSVCELAEEMTDLSETPGATNGSVKQASGPGLEHLMWPCSPHELLETQPEGGLEVAGLAGLDLVCEAHYLRRSSASRAYTAMASGTVCGTMP